MRRCDSSMKRHAEGNSDGEEGEEAATTMDQGRRPRAEDAREKAKTSVIAGKLKRTLRATQQKASTLGVKLGAS